jgi:hypothetical protein
MLGNRYHTCPVWERALGWPKAPDADVVLVPGNPPLTRGIVADVRGFFELILNIDLSALTAMVEKTLINDWQDPEMVDFIKLVARLKAADPVMRALARGKPGADRRQLAQS